MADSTSDVLIPSNGGINSRMESLDAEDDIPLLTLFKRNTSESKEESTFLKNKHIDHVISFSDEKSLTPQHENKQHPLKENESFTANQVPPLLLLINNKLLSASLIAVENVSSSVLHKGQASSSFPSFNAVKPDSKSSADKEALQKVQNGLNKRYSDLQNGSLIDVKQSLKSTRDSESSNYISILKQGEENSKSKKNKDVFSSCNRENSIKSINNNINSFNKAHNMIFVITGQVGKQSNTPSVSIADNSSSHDSSSFVFDNTVNQHFRCGTCGIDFCDLDSFISHSHSVEHPLECDVCHKRLSSKVALKDHKMTHSDLKPFACNVCNCKFNLPYKLKEHMRHHTGERPYKCDVCPMSFMRNRNLAAHKKRHSAVKTVECGVCSKRFFTSAELVKHMLIHSNKPFKCELCQARFPLKASLKIHAMMHTRGKPFKCKACDAKFFSIRNLFRHLGKHNGHSGFKCVLCGATFKTRASCRIHVMAHYGVKPFKCSQCSASYNIRSKLRDHMWQHTGIKAHQCQYCSGRFSSATHRAKHEKKFCLKSPFAVTGSGDFQCYVCGSRFLSAIDLEKHSLVHREKASLKCNLCPLQFTAKIDLVEHMISHTSSEAFTCYVCQASFAIREYLNNHMQEHVKEEGT